MKKLVISVTLIAIVLSSYSQNKPTVSEEGNVIKVNVLSLIVGTGSLFYERKITDNISGQMGVGYLNYTINEGKFTGLILTPEARFYPKKNAIDGFYLSPYLRYQNFQIKDTETNDKGTYTNFGGGVAFGRQWITDSGFTMDLFLADITPRGK